MESAEERKQRPEEAEGFVRCRARRGITDGGNGWDTCVGDTRTISVDVVGCRVRHEATGEGELTKARTGGPGKAH